MTIRVLIYGVLLLTAAFITSQLIPSSTTPSDTPPAALRWEQSIPSCNGSSQRAAYLAGYSFGREYAVGYLMGQLSNDPTDWLPTANAWAGSEAENTCHRFGITEGWNHYRTTDATALNLDLGGADA